MRLAKGKEKEIWDRVIESESVYSLLIRDINNQEFKVWGGETTAKDQPGS